MVIIKGIQFALSLMHPLPNVREIQWKQSPHLPLDQLHQKKAKQQQAAKKKKKEKQPKTKRPPRNVRLERLYTGSPVSYDELDASFGRRSAGSNPARDRPPTTNTSRYEDFGNGREPQVLHHAVSRRYTPLLLGLPNHSSYLTQIQLEQLSFVEDDEEDPIEAYVQQQHQRMLAQHHHSNRSSTPIQQHQNRTQHGQGGGYQHPKSRATIV